MRLPGHPAAGLERVGQGGHVPGGAAQGIGELALEHRPARLVQGQQASARAGVRPAASVTGNVGLDSADPGAEAAANLEARWQAKPDVDADGDG
jgi:hypothetical protein